MVKKFKPKGIIVISNKTKDDLTPDSWVFCF